MGARPGEGWQRCLPASPGHAPARACAWLCVLLQRFLCKHVINKGGRIMNRGMQCVALIPEVHGLWRFFIRSPDEGRGKATGKAAAPSRAVPHDALLHHPQSILWGPKGHPLQTPSARAVAFLSSEGPDAILPASDPGLWWLCYPLCSCQVPAGLPGCAGFVAVGLIHPVPTWAASWQLLLQKPLPGRGTTPCAHHGQMVSEILRQKPRPKRGWEAGP